VGGKFLGRFSSRATGVMPRAAAGAQTIPLSIVQNVPRPKYFTAPHGLERLLEERFCLRRSKPAITIARGRFGVAVGDALNTLKPRVRWR
jgi:hypothetical protein